MKNHTPAAAELQPVRRGRRSVREGHGAWFDGSKNRLTEWAFAKYHDLSSASGFCGLSKTTIFQEKDGLGHECIHRGVDAMGNPTR